MFQRFGVPLYYYVTDRHQNSLRSRLACGAFWSILGATISRGLTLIGAIAAGRLLGKAGFGELGMIQSTLGLFGVFAGAGLGLTATKYVAQYRSTDLAKSGKYISLALAIAVVTGILTSLILFSVSPWIADEVLKAPSLVWDLRIATALVFFGAINGVQIGAVVGLEDFRTMAVMSIIRAGFLLVSLTLGASFAGLRGAVIGLTVAEAASACANQWALQQACGKTSIPLLYSSINWSDSTVFWEFSLPALLSSIVTQPALWLSSVLLVNQPDGFAALGVFNAADKWRQLLAFIPTSISSAVLPMLSNLHGKGDRAGYKRVFNLNLALSLGLVLIPALALAVLARPAMSVYGAQYQEGGSVLIILSIAATAISLNTTLGQVLVTAGLIWWRFGLDTLLACLLILTSWWLIPTEKENGLALANLMAFLITSLVLTVIVVRYLHDWDSD